MYESPLDRPGTDALDVYALPVVGDLDDDHVAFVRGFEKNRPGLVLSHRAPLLGTLDAVVERIAHRMHEGVQEILDHGLVQLRFLALDHEFDALVEGLERSRTSLGNGRISG